MGSLAGAALFPTQLPPGPQISDNRTTTSAVGGPVSLVFGTASVSGTVIWLAPYVQSTNEQTAGGKGGPEQLTYQYNQSIAIGIAERVDDFAADTVGAISGISRIWENGTIVYDIRPQQSADSDLGSIAETDQQYANRLTASAAYAETFVLYLGDENQLPDPTMEAVQGVGQVPPFRGLAYIVYPNRLLTVAQGWRHPNFQFEVYQAGTGDCTQSTNYSAGILYPWGSAPEDPTNERNTNSFAVVNFDSALVTLTGEHYSDYPYLGSPWPTLDDAIGTLTPFYKVPLTYIGYASPLSFGGSGEVQQTSGPQAGVPQPTDYISAQSNTVDILYNFKQPDHGFWTDDQRINALIPYTYPNQPPLNATYHQGVSGVFGQLVTSLNYTAPGDAGLFPPWPAPFVNGSVYETAGWPAQFYLYDARITVTRSPAPPSNPCDGLTPSVEVPGYAVQADGTLIKCQEWTLIAGPYTNWKCMQNFNAAGGTKCYPMNPMLPSTDVNYDNETFWQAAYSQLVASGQMVNGLVYGTDYPVTPSTATGVYEIDNEICIGGGEGVSIGSIIAAICNRSGLTAIDTTDMNEVSINGYAVSSVCTGTSILTPLRSIGFFDAVETDAMIKFPARGKPIVATFTTDDFGCYDASQTENSTGPTTAQDQYGFSTVPPSITTARSQDEDLPRSIRFHYVATSRDYEDGEQDSPFRLATAAINDVDITVPVCLGDVQAAKCASVLWADAWAARSSYSLSIDQSWLQLDVGDAILVPVDGVMQRMRITNDTNSSAVLRKLSCVADDGGAYLSFAVASQPQRVPQVLTFIGPTSFELMDLPCLQDADSDPGFYVAAQRSDNIGNGWKGCVIYKSVDNGSTFTTQFSLITEATMGVLAEAVPASEPYTWDEVTQIIVNVTANFSFESLTDDQVLAGGNGAAMGADGRWEIIQFATATQVTATQWILSRLLRGRRGTEHVMGTSQTGDLFVMVSTGDLGRVVLETTEIGAQRVYKAVSIGASFSSGSTQPFTGEAEALVCFSPVNPAAVRVTDGDILISWTRRSRLGRTLMSGVDIPLGEATEAFSIDILEPHSPASPEIVLRTLTSSTPDVLYSHANQETDFGSPLPSTIKVAIYQLSAITGRGTPVVATLNVTEV